MVKCTLAKDINKCPFCNKEIMECTKSDIKCGFRREDEPVGNSDYVRKERWYEKYYKGTRPVK